jgi:solute:Na+ symporter, SSS family
MPGSQAHFLDLLVLLASVVVFLGIGVYFSGRQKSTGNYFKAGGGIPAWVVGFSILATLVSSVTFLAYPGAGFQSNWILLVQGLMVPLVLVGLVWIVVPLYREVIGLSAYEYFEKRFGLMARVYSSLAFSFAHFTKMGTVFFLMTVALSQLSGLDAYLILWLLGIIIIIITLIGGIEAVIWADLFQGLLLIFAGLVTAGLILFITPGGPEALLSTAWEKGKIGFGPYDLSFAKLTFLVMALNGVFYALQKYGTDQTIVQRYLTARSDRDAVKASLIGVFLCVPVWALFMFIGTALYAFYEITALPIPPGMTAEQVFPYFMMTQLPPGMVGLILAGLVAAAISTLDTDLNCLAAVAVEDYYSRLKKNVTDRAKLVFGKIVVVLCGLAAIGIASLYIRLGGEGVLGIVFDLYAIFSGGMVGLFLLGLMTRRANKQGVYIGIACCVVFTAWATLSSTSIPAETGKRLILDLGDYNFTHHRYMLGVYSHLILFGVGYVASLFFASRPPEDNLTIHGWLEKRRKRRGAAVAPEATPETVRQ